MHHCQVATSFLTTWETPPLTRSAIGSVSITLSRAAVPATVILSAIHRLNVHPLLGAQSGRTRVLTVLGLTRSRTSWTTLMIPVCSGLHRGKMRERMLCGRLIARVGSLRTNQTAIGNQKR